jgi:hypothetical protein
MLRRIETQAPLAEMTERGVFGEAVCGSYSAHAGVLSDTMEMSLGGRSIGQAGGRRW